MQSGARSDRALNWLKETNLAVTFTRLQNSSFPILSEKLAYWFFRLNGCLTIENFVVHPNVSGSQQTDADILGVRFPYREELSGNPMRDHPAFSNPGDKPMLFIAEVKLDKCRLNGPWTKPPKKNMQRVLQAIGVVTKEEIEPVAQALYDNQYYEDEKHLFRLFVLGDQANRGYRHSKPNVIQITWMEALDFIYTRFRTYRDQKADHSQWEDQGKALWDAAMMYYDPVDFATDIRQRLQDSKGNRLIKQENS